MWKPILFIVAILTLSSQAQASPVGSFDVEGKNPGSESSYQGGVSVSRTGHTYRVRWRVGRQTFIGTGLGATFKEGKFVIGPADKDDSLLAVSYISDGSFGLAFFIKRNDDSWEGIWTYGGSRKIGRENWFPR